MYPKLLYICVIILAIGSCNKERTLTEEYLVIGNWNWVESRGGFSYHIETPSSTGRSMQFIFNRRNTFSQTINGSVYETGKYKLAIAPDIPYSNGKKVLELNNYRVYILSEINGDSLVLTEPVADGFTYTYIRQ